VRCISPGRLVCLACGGRGQRLLPERANACLAPGAAACLPMRRSHSWTVLSSAKISALCSGSRFFHRPAELAWMPHGLAIWPGFFSPVTASMATWHLCLGEYRFLATSGASLDMAHVSFRAGRLHFTAVANFRRSQPSSELKNHGDQEVLSVDMDRSILHQSRRLQCISTPQTPIALRRKLNCTFG